MTLWALFQLLCSEVSFYFKLLLVSSYVEMTQFLGSCLTYGINGLNRLKYCLFLGFQGVSVRMILMIAMLKFIVIVMLVCGDTALAVILGLCVRMDVFMFACWLVKLGLYQ